MTTPEQPASPPAGPPDETLEDRMKKVLEQLGALTTSACNQPSTTDHTNIWCIDGTEEAADAVPETPPKS